MTELKKSPTAPTVEDLQNYQFITDNITNDIMLPQGNEKINSKFFKLHIDNVSYKEKPKSEVGAIKPRLQKSEPVSVTLNELAQKLLEGYTISSGVLEGGCSAGNWIEQQLFMIDIDNDKKDAPILTPPEAFAICEQHNLPVCLMYDSFSSTDAKPKYRLGFMCNEVVTDPAIRSMIMQSLISLFNQADTACGNADRIFFGTNKDVAINEKAFFTVEDAIAAYAPPKTEYRYDDNNELDRLKKEFDFFSYLKIRNGELKFDNQKCAMFRRCEICGHSNDLVYYKSTKTFYCFSSSGSRGGSVIDYLMATDRMDLKTAIDFFKHDLCGVARPKKGRPKKEKTDDPANEKIIGKYLTVEGLQSFMQDNDVSVRYDVIKRLADIQGLEKKYSGEHLLDALPLILTEYVNNSGLYEKRVNKNAVQDFLSITLAENSRQYNPVVEMLNSAKWDDIDRLNDFYNILHIDGNDTLSQILIYKWMWQSLSMARNELNGAFGADGVLTLQGLQGIGKTSLFRKMAVKQEFFKEGARIDFRDKDTARRATSYWIVELGEIESTFKSDVEALKAFIVNSTDEYRLPYGRTDSHHARRASLCGTCNNTEFLIDPTGNRRFWTVPVDTVDLPALDKFDMLQLWLQVDHFTKDNIQGFRLTKDERTLLEERNAKHEKPLKAEMEIRDIIYKADNFDINSSPVKLVYREVTVSDFKKSHSLLKNYSVQQIGQALTKIGIDGNPLKKINGVPQRLRRLPVWDNGSFENAENIKE